MVWLYKTGTKYKIVVSIGKYHYFVQEPMPGELFNCHHRMVETYKIFQELSNIIHAKIMPIVIFLQKQEIKI